MIKEDVLREFATGYWRQTVRRDYLVKGLYSAVLTPPTPELTITMMLVPPNRGDVLPEDLLSPHNHAYDFAAWVFSGEIIDRAYHEVSFEDGMQSKEPVCAFFKYIYDMHPGGGIGDTALGERVLLAIKQEERLGAGGSFAMTRHDIHDVMVLDQPDPAIWIRVETDRIPAPTMLYNKRDVGQKIGTVSSRVDASEIEPWLRMGGFAC